MVTCTEHLKTCIEKSVKRQGIEFAEEFGKYGLWADPFTGWDYPLASNFDLHFVDRLKEIESLCKDFVNSFMGRGEDTAIVGAEGMGARSLVNLFKNYAYALENEDEDSINSKIKRKLQDMFDMKARSANEDVIARLKQQIEVAVKQKKTILVLSSFDEKAGLLGKSSEAKIQFRKLLEIDRMSHDLAVFFSPWNATAFDFMLEEEYSAVSIYEKVIFLNPLSLAETENLIRARLKMYKHDDAAKVNLISDEGIKAIAAFSGGIPKYALKFSGIVLDESIKAKRDSPLNAKYVGSTLSKYEYASYSEFSKRLKELIPKHWWETKQGKTRTEMKILKNAILMGAPSTSTEIGKLIGKSRVAVLENLKKLEKAGIIKYIEHGKDSRKRPFEVNDFAKSVFEHEFIIPEIEKRWKSENL